LRLGFVIAFLFAHGYSAGVSFGVGASMSLEPQKHEPETKPVFRLLAGFFGILSLIAGCFSIVSAFQSTGSTPWRWITEASLFLLVGAAFVHAAISGHWGIRR
jgi:hypothetical protein